MPRNGLGMPISASQSQAAPVVIDDVLWEDFGGSGGEIAVNYQETRTNSVLHSQDATDAEAWTKAATSIDSTLYKAPDGSDTANAIKSNNTGSRNYKITQSSLTLTTGKTYTVSAHVKKGTLGFARIKSHDGSTAFRADFNLTTGAVTNTTNTIRTQVDVMDDDWYRCSITFQATATTSSAYVEVFACAASGDSTPNVAVSGIVLIYVWGFQLEESIEATSYIVTTTSARTATTTLNDTSDVWDFDSADLMPEADPDSEGVWETLDNLILNGNYEELGSNLVTNGTFETDSDWSVTRGNWAISGGTLNTTSESDYCNITIGDYSNKTMRVKFDIVSYTQGSVAFRIFGNSYQVETLRSGIGTYTEDIVFQSGHNGAVGFQGNNFTGAIDNVSVKQVDPNDRWNLGTGWSIEDGKAVATSGTGSKVTQNISGLSGKSAEVTFTLSDVTNGGVIVDFGSTISATISTNGTHTVYGTYDINQFELYKGGAFSGSVDNVTVREYAIQPQDV